MDLNRSALQEAEVLVRAAERHRAVVSQAEGGGRILDCGVETPGGLAAGLGLARICLAGLADVSLIPCTRDLPASLDVLVATDHPIAACLASQYAGWQIQVGSYFAMGSGPMRAIAGREPVFETIGLRETPSAAIGVLEAEKLPPPEVFAYLAEKLRLPTEAITLAVAPVTSIAGVTQVVARSLETALHKLHELHFDLSRVISGTGVAPLPPPHPKMMTSMGRTNDAILYGGDVTLYVRGDDASLIEIGARLPSSSSRDYGMPFAELFKKYDHDFYKVDPLLFSPARVTIVNLDSGRTHLFGSLAPELCARSFGG